MSHTKALLILCPDMLTPWNSMFAFFSCFIDLLLEDGGAIIYLLSCKKMVLYEKYDFTRLKDELQLCALILSYSPNNESTWSQRLQKCRWKYYKVNTTIFLHSKISEGIILGHMTSTDF